MIEFKDVSKVYPNGVVGLDNVNLKIEQGEFVAIIGLSGAGKSTLLRTINRMHDITSGTLTVDGLEVKNLKGKELRTFRRKIGMIFQSFNLVTRTTVIRNVLMAKVPEMPFWRVLLGVFKKEDKMQALESLDKVGILDKAYIRADQLSGGQQQRVAIARALVCDPEVILLDEPLGALDLKLRKSMQIELKEIQQNSQKTFIYVTHDQEEALTMSDTVIVMNNGVVEQVGSPEDIYNEPVNAFVADFIGEANILNGTMLGDCRVEILGKQLECVDKGFGENTPVDVVIRPEDIEITSPENGQLTGTVVKSTFKGVHYEMSVMCGKCEILIHSTSSAEIGSQIGMHVIPFNIQIMNKLLPFYNNEIEVTVSSANEDENTFSFEFEDETIEVPNHYFKEGTKLKIILPPDALSLAGDGNGDLTDLYIESVIYKGEHNEIILESDTRKWLMLSDTDEQVATYVPLSFDFDKAKFEVLSDKEG